MIISLPLTTGTVFFVSAISVVDYSFLWLLIWVTLKVCGAHSTWILNSVGSLTESMWYKHEDSHNILFLLFRNKYTPYYSSKYKLYWKLDSFFSTATGSDSSKCQVGLEKKKKKNLFNICYISDAPQRHLSPIWHFLWPNIIVVHLRCNTESPDILRTSLEDSLLEIFYPP